jgi:hypothetical protein
MHLRTLAFDHHAEQIREALHELRVGAIELALVRAVDLQHVPVPFATDRHGDIDGAPDAMRNEERRCPESLLVLEMIREYRSPGPEGEARWRGEVRAQPGRTDKAGLPTGPGADQQTIFLGKILEHLAEPGAHALRTHPRSLVQDRLEGSASECTYPEVGGNPLSIEAIRQLVRVRAVRPPPSDCARLCRSDTPGEHIRSRLTAAIKPLLTKTSNSSGPVCCLIE